MIGDARFECRHGTIYPLIPITMSIIIHCNFIMDSRLDSGKDVVDKGISISRLIPIKDIIGWTIDWS